MESARLRPEGDMEMEEGLIGGVVDPLIKSGSRSPFATLGVEAFGTGLAS